MKHWKYLVLILITLLICTLSFGCQSATPREDLSVNEMERIYLENQADFNAFQNQLDLVTSDTIPSDSFRTLRITRSNAEKKTADGASKETLMISSDYSFTDVDRTALLQAAAPLFDQTAILLIFANNSELYFYYYEEWGYEHFIGYREDGEIPAGSFGNVEDWKQIGENWYAVIAHD